MNLAKSSHVKQYFKEQRALRLKRPSTIRRTFTWPTRCRICHTSATWGTKFNRKLPEVERVSQQGELTQDALDRLQRPTLEPYVRFSSQANRGPEACVAESR